MGISILARLKMELKIQKMDSCGLMDINIQAALKMIQNKGMAQSSQKMALTISKGNFSMIKSKERVNSSYKGKVLFLKSTLDNFAKTNFTAAEFM